MNRKIKLLVLVFFASLNWASGQDSGDFHIRLNMMYKYNTPPFYKQEGRFGLSGLGIVYDKGLFQHQLEITELSYERDKSWPARVTTCQSNFGLRYQFAISPLHNTEKRFFNPIFGVSIEGTNHYMRSKQKVINLEDTLPTIIVQEPHLNLDLVVGNSFEIGQKMTCHFEIPVNAIHYEKWHTKVKYLSGQTKKQDEDSFSTFTKWLRFRLGVSYKL